MSDGYQIVVFPRVRESDAPAKGQAILRWLWDRRIIERTGHRSESDQAMRAFLAQLGMRDPRSAGQAYLPDEGARAYVVDPEQYVGWPGETAGPAGVYGMELITHPWIHGDFNVPSFSTCPECEAITPEREWWEPPMSDVTQEWFRSGRALLHCAACGRSSDFSAWTFDPPAVCGSLALRFGNWPELSMDLIESLEQIADSPAVRSFELI